MDNVVLDILKIIITLLDEPTQCIARFVCKRWYSIIPKQKNRLSDYITSLSLLKWAYHNGARLNDEISICIGQTGTIEMYEWCIDHGADLYGIVRGAISQERLVFLHYIHHDYFTRRSYSRQDIPIKILIEFAIRTIQKRQSIQTIHRVRRINSIYTSGIFNKAISKAQAVYINQEYK